MGAKEQEIKVGEKWRNDGFGGWEMFSSDFSWGFNGIYRESMGL